MRLAVVVTYDVNSPEDVTTVVRQLIPEPVRPLGTTAGVGRVPLAWFDGKVRVVVDEDVDHLTAWLDDGVPTPGGESGT